jgi:hypothetical protein
MPQGDTESHLIHCQNAERRSSMAAPSALKIPPPARRSTGAASSFRLVRDANVRVTHCHLNVAVTSEAFGLWQRRAVTKQLGNVRVTASRMEVGDAVRLTY